MRPHLIDGTYELFRHHFGAAPRQTPGGVEIGATIGVLGSVLGLLQSGVTHIGVATDKVIESFRNGMFAGYKTSAGVPQELLSQFPILEEALESMGVLVWPMVDWEADDALASAAAVCDADPRVEQVVICTPDKDLGQCVRGTRVVQLNRRKDEILDAAGVRAKFGVDPESIPDYLALVGDASDGYPGIPGFGAKTVAAVLAKFNKLEAIPRDGADWPAGIRGPKSLAATLDAKWTEALLYRDLATLRTEPSVLASVDDLRWAGPTPDFEAYSTELGSNSLWGRALAASRGR